MEQQLLFKIKVLEEENEKLKFELQETKDHLKKYTSPDRCKKYYKENKEIQSEKNLKRYHYNQECKKFRNILLEI